VIGIPDLHLVDALEVLRDVEFDHMHMREWELEATVATVA
jgi:hypothetical protein